MAIKAGTNKMQTDKQNLVPLRNANKSIEVYMFAVISSCGFQDQCQGRGGMVGCGGERESRVRLSQGPGGICP